LFSASLMTRVGFDADRLDDEFDTAASEVFRPEQTNISGLPSTWFGFLWQNEPRLLALSGVAQLSWSSFIMTGAYYFVNEMIANREETTGLGLCFLYLGSIIIIVLSYQCKELWVGQMGANVKKVLAARVAEHALLHGPLSAGDKSLALVLASQDAHSICEGAKNVWQLPAAISEGTVITALVIWRTTSLTGAITSGVLIAGFSFLFSMSWLMNKLKHDVTEIQDKQASLFGEVLANMRSFRYYGWDSYFLKRLHGMTDALIPAQQKLVIMKAVNSCLVIAFPLFPAIALFVASYYDTGKGPTVPFQALVLSLLNTFRCTPHYNCCTQLHRSPWLKVPAVELALFSASSVFRQQLLRPPHCIPRQLRPNRLSVNFCSARGRRNYKPACWSPRQRFEGVACSARKSGDSSRTSEIVQKHNT
jgi:hypothetical protein